MYRELIHIYGPFGIQSYGVALVLGLMVFTYLILNDQRRASLLTIDQALSLVTQGILAAIVGGRMLFVAMSWNHLSWTEIIAVWDGGFSVLGSIIGVIIVLVLSLHINRIPIYGFLDLVSLYAPVLQAIARLGCLCAGCCFGSPCRWPWAIVFSDPQGYAPIGIGLHPTQLYSSLMLAGSFLLLVLIRNYTNIPGIIFGSYLVLAGIERLILDLFRADRELIHGGLLHGLSVHLLIACGIALAGIIVLATSYDSYRRRQR